LGICNDLPGEFDIEHRGIAYAGLGFGLKIFLTASERETIESPLFMRQA